MKRKRSAQNGPLTRSKSARTSLTIVPSPETVDPAALREMQAKKLFIKLARRWRDRKLLDPIELTTLHSYVDIITSQKLQDWYYIAGNGCYYDIELEYGRVIFNRKQSNLYFHRLSSYFSTDFWRQMDINDDQFIGLGRADVFLTHNTMRQPCASFCLNDSPHNKIVFDTARDEEDMEALLSRRDWHLGHHTQTNIWIGVKYFVHNGTWWIGVARRDFEPKDPPPEPLPDKWPPSIWIDQFACHRGLSHVNIHDVRTESWKIPTIFLYYPDPVPSRDPPLPGSYTMELEKYRNKLLKCL